MYLGVQVWLAMDQTNLRQFYISTEWVFEFKSYFVYGAASHILGVTFISCV